MPKLPNAPSFLGELLGVRPSLFGEFLDGDPAAMVVVLEAAFVDDIRGFLAALGDDVLGAEVVCGGSQVSERELGEARCDSSSTGRDDGVGAVEWWREMVVAMAVEIFAVVVVVTVVVVFVVSMSFQKGRLTTAHNSVELTRSPTSSLLLAKLHTELE